MSSINDFKSGVKPNWCPGCGDFSVLFAIQKAVAELDIQRENLAVVSGIGCSGRVSGYVKAYGFHSIHGRALPVAQGLKIANHDLTVIASGGDGDGFAIGLGHTIHAMRRNINITYIVMDNQIYGLTKGQASPCSDMGFVTKSTPDGSIEAAISPVQLALSARCTFVAQGFSSNIKELTGLITAGIKHDGFSLINVFSPCVTYNKVNTYDWYKKNIVSVNSLEGYDPEDYNCAMKAIEEHNGLVTGLIYKNDKKDAYEKKLKGYRDKPIANETLTVNKTYIEKLFDQFI